MFLALAWLQGYWKTHVTAWPVDSMQLGVSGHWYNKAQLSTIMNKPDGGNGLLKLAHQLIAAILNTKNGASDVPVQQQIADAKDLLQNFGSLVNVPTPSINDKSPFWAKAVELAGALDNYNKGNSGVGHC
jgi:hypothetical protein